MTGPFIGDVREEERVTSLRTSALEVPVSGFRFPVSGFYESTLGSISPPVLGVRKKIILK